MINWWGNAVDNGNSLALPWCPLTASQRFSQIPTAQLFTVRGKIIFLLVHGMWHKREAVLSPWTWLISELEDRISSASFWAVGSTSVWWAVIRYWTNFCSWSLFIWNNVSEMGNRSLTCIKHSLFVRRGKIWEYELVYGFHRLPGCSPAKTKSLGWNERPPPGKLKPAARIDGDTVQWQLQKTIWLSWN